MNPYRPEPPPPYDRAKALWPVYRTSLLALWGIAEGYFGIIGLLRWFEFGSPWPAFIQFVYWAPTLPVIYVLGRWAYFRWPPPPRP